MKNIEQIDIFLECTSIIVHKRNQPNSVGTGDCGEHMNSEAVISLGKGEVCVVFKLNKKLVIAFGMYMTYHMKYKSLYINK